MRENPQSQQLLPLLAELNSQEQSRLAPAATCSDQAIRRWPEELHGYRQPFAMDADRILHSRAYTRYLDKTQVFSLVSNDHITHRMLHVQLVARISRTIGRFLRLNEDLIEAIALGHDIGHPPFGHEGERILSRLCRECGLPPFQHNLQSVRFLDFLERRGKGWNLSLQTLDGILCHDGEKNIYRLRPEPINSFTELDSRYRNKQQDSGLDLPPATAEGCVVRLADTIAYIGRDIEDAIVLGQISRTDIPPDCGELLGTTNGTIVYNLVTDLIVSSHTVSPVADIGFSPRTAELLAKLKDFNYRHIYLAPGLKAHLNLIDHCYRQLFDYYLQCLKKETQLPPGVDIMANLEPREPVVISPEEMVRDFIAGMTDDFFLSQAQAIGCQTPKKS